MNAFERHGIDHLSSSLNLWRASPGLWSARYLADLKEDGNNAMWRGTAVEAGLRHVLYGAPLEEARQAAIDSFEGNAVGAGSVTPRSSGQPLDASRL
jgi:hypothetical protein